MFFHTTGPAGRRCGHDSASPVRRQRMGDHVHCTGKQGSLEAAEQESLLPRVGLRNLAPILRRRRRRWNDYLARENRQPEKVIQSNPVLSLLGIQGFVQAFKVLLTYPTTIQDHSFWPDLPWRAERLWRSSICHGYFAVNHMHQEKHISARGRTFPKCGCPHSAQCKGMLGQWPY